MKKFETPDIGEISYYESFHDMEKGVQADINSIVSDVYLRNPLMRYIVILDEYKENVLGVVVYLPEDSRNPHLAILKEIFVHEEYRNRGIGTQLMDEFEYYTNGQSKQLVVLENNTRAIQFYLRRGYKVLNDPSSQMVMEKE